MNLRISHEKIISTFNMYCKKNGEMGNSIYLPLLRVLSLVKKVP